MNSGSRCNSTSGAPKSSTIMKIKQGIYLHYKGVKIRVIGVGLHSETLEELVLYEKLGDFGEYKKGSLWVRPKKMFLEKVTVNNKKIPRFKFISG